MISIPSLRNTSSTLSVNFWSRFRIRRRSRWAIEVQYRDLKSELGLDHFEGPQLSRLEPSRRPRRDDVDVSPVRTPPTRRPAADVSRVRNLVGEIMAALLWTARPEWFTRHRFFSGIRRCESDNVVLKVHLGGELDDPTR
jgi:hypothetical protein